MSDIKKQPKFTRSLLRPSIPPPVQSQARGSRGCCCRVLSVLWKLLAAIIVIIVLAILIFWLIVQPLSFKFHVTNANLTKFDYTNNTLHCDLVLNFTAHNPNKKLGIYYDEMRQEHSMKATGSYLTTWLNSFRQDNKTSNTLGGVFRGQQVMVFEISAYNEEKKSGIFSTDVNLYFEIRFRLGDFIIHSYYACIPRSNVN